MDRVKTTLFMISSVDGKISTGNVDERDIDKDFPKIVGIKEGLPQYYGLEKKTDYWSLNTGKVMAKIGANVNTKEPQQIESLRFVIIDNKPHLKKSGVNYLSKKVKTLYIVTTNKNHPAFQMDGNIEVIHYPNKIDFSDLFVKLRSDYGAKRLTIQSGGTLNATLLREKLIDRLSVVIAPALIGGFDTSSLIEGKSLQTENDLKHIKSLKLIKCEKLKKSYVHLVYQVINETKIE